MKSSNEHFNLEENLVLTNEELTSNWAKLASLIRAYEKGSWDQARKKALQLMKEGGAIGYIEQVRKNPEGELKTTAEKPKDPLIVKLANERTIYEKNYDKLLAIAPGLEQRLLKANLYEGEPLYGKSKKTGYMDFNLELVYQDKDSYYLAMSHFYIQNGDVVADPDMEIRLDLKKRIVEALHFQNAFYYSEVYDDKYNRKLVNNKEKKSQNAFLSTWLTNLKEQGHKIKWKEPESTGIAKSVIVDHYKKEEKQQEDPAPKKTESNPIPADSKTEKAPSENKESVEFRFSAEQVKKMISIIVFLNGFSQQKAEAKADDLIRKSKAIDYLLDGYELLKLEQLVHVLQVNYKQLTVLIPDLLEKLSSDKVTVRLVSERTDMHAIYEIAHGTNKGNPDIRLFSIYENNKGGDSGATMMIGVNSAGKQAWIEILSGGFFQQEDYFDDKQTPLADKRYHANRFLSRWLDIISSKHYKPEWNDTGHTVPEVSEEPHKEHDINEGIPDFEPGHVQLTETHKKHGITQQDIDWINKHQQGMTLTPRTKTMIPTTKDMLMDKSIQAQRPGFRISWTGKFYYEGRSNRSDRTDKGL